MENNAPAFFDGPNARLAYRMHEGEDPTIVWLGGYASDMLGTKAEALATYAKEADQAYLRFDYSGHGESEGHFEDGTLSTWFADAESLIGDKAPGRKILVGSSMGAWLTLLYAKKHPAEVSAVVLIAPAPDFTEDLVWPRLSQEHRDRIEKDGFVKTGPTGHASETYTQALFEDGRANLVLRTPITLPCPVCILQGTQDEAVPVAHALKVADAIDAPSVTTTLVKDGDHRLSNPEDLYLLIRTVSTFIEN
ncbi:MAG: alpha/beta hydrolase [Pseudomonadota bacterium]